MSRQLHKAYSIPKRHDEHPRERMISILGFRHRCHEMAVHCTDKKFTLELHSPHSLNHCHSRNHLCQFHSAKYLSFCNATRSGPIDSEVQLSILLEQFCCRFLNGWTIFCRVMEFFCSLKGIFFSSILLFCWNNYDFGECILNFCLIQPGRSVKRVSSFGPAPVCWAGGRGFKPRPNQHLGSLNNCEESASFVMTSAKG